MQSGTGVYYQAMPAVGPDGKNVIKLIPVKKVNGKFVQTQVLPSGNVPLPAYQSPVPSTQNSVPTLQLTADGRFILKPPLEVNSVKSQQKGADILLRTTADQPQFPNISHSTARNTCSAAPVPSNNKAEIVPNSPQLPNTVKPPAIQSKRYLQIPSNATVRTLPASARPPSIKNRICHSSNNANPSNGLQMVMCVSPVSSLKFDQEVPCLTNTSALPQTSAPTSTASAVERLEKSTGNNQGGTTPMKWVVKEQAGCRAPYLIPVTSPSMSSDILKAVKQMESNQVAKEPVSTDLSQEVVTPVNDNALVMCNGKVYLVAKKNSQVTKDMMTNEESTLQPRKPAQSPNALGQKQDPESQTDNKKPSDIIDLCDDEEESSTCTSPERIPVPSDAVSESDEDSNVIFVSYIPPKSTETSKVSQSSCVYGTEEPVLDPESLETGNEVNSVHGAEVDGSEAVDAAGAALEGSEALPDKMEVVCGRQTNVTEKSFAETIHDPIRQPKSDSELRRTFGITLDLSVSLQKIDSSRADHSQNQRRLINKRALDGIRQLIHNSDVKTKIKQLIQRQSPNPVKTGKRKRLDGNEDKNVSDTFSLIDADSSKLSNSLSDCNDEIQSASNVQSKDQHVFHRCQVVEGKPLSTNGAGIVYVMTADVHCSSPLVAPQAHTANCQDDGGCSGLRKTLPRSSKGCGRVCTACSCGTKVGGVAGNSASKL